MKPSPLAPVALALAFAAGCAHVSPVAITAQDGTSYQALLDAHVKLHDQDRDGRLETAEATGTWLGRDWSALDLDRDGRLRGDELKRFLEGRRRALGALDLGSLADGTAMTNYLTHLGAGAAQRHRFQPRDPFVATPASSGQAYENVTLTSPAGLKLAAWWVPAAAPTGKSVLLLHGLGSSKSWAYRTYGRWLATRYNVLALDFRGHGGSEGGSSSLGVHEVAEAQAAIAELHRRGQTRVAVMGMSMGASIGLVATARTPGVDVVIADSAYARLGDALTHHATREGAAWPTVVGQATVKVLDRDLGTAVTANDPLDRMTAIAPRPLLLIHGGADTTTPPDHAQRLYDAALLPKWIAIIPGAGHAASYDALGPSFEAGVLDYLSQTL